MAGQFEIQYNQRVPSVVSMPRANMNVDTGAGDIGRAVSGFGGAMFEVGQKIQVAQDAMDLSLLNRQGEEMDLAAEQQLTKITDADEQEKFIQAHEQKRSAVAIKSNSRVQNAYQINHNNNTADRQRRFYSVGLQARAKDAEDKGRFAYQSAVDSGNEFEARKINALRLATETIGKEEYDYLESNLPVDMKFASIRKTIDTNPAQAVQELANPEFRKSLSPNQLDAADRLGSIAKKRQEVSSDESNKQLTDLMASQKLTINEIQARRNLLPANDYESWMKIALNPADKKGNVIKTAELKSTAMDVWRGTLSRTDAEAKIRESLADPNGINDDQFAAVYADLDREVKGYQAQDTKTYSIDATRLILGKDSGVMTFDALGNVTIDIYKMLSPQAEFERKMHFVDLYNKSMSDYIAENPKVSKKDLYIKSQELKETYTRAAKGTGTEPVKQEPIADIVSDEDWKKLKLGQKFRGPDKIVRTK